MQEQPKTQLLEQHKKFSLHYLTGHSFDWYARAAIRPIMYLAVLNSLLYLISNIPGTGPGYIQVFVPIIVIVEMFTYIWLGWYTAYKTSWKTLPPGATLATTITTGALTGIGLGIYVVFFKIFWFREFWTIYNIITEPIVRGFEGLIFTGLAGIITLTVIAIKAKHHYPQAYDTSDKKDTKK